MEASKLQKIFEQAVRKVLKEELESIEQIVKKVLKEELYELGKQKLNESISFSQPYTQPKQSTNEWPTVKLTTNDIAPDFKKSLMDSMGMTLPDSVTSEVQSGISSSGNVYTDMLAQVARDMRNNPGEVANFRNI